MRVGIVGSGSWGTALAIVLADNAHQVEIWARRSEQADEINRNHTNEEYLPGIQLPDTIKASSKLEQVVEGKEMILFVVPSHSIRQVARQVSGYIPQEALIIHAIKGLELETHKRISEILLEELPVPLHERIAVLSGPSHAEEVSKRSPTTVVVASNSIKTAEEAQDALINQHFRVYTNPDVVGLEIGGALKNIIALGAGISDGLQFGDNAKAALMTRGLAEISRLGVYMGANPLTFSGLAGVGDLIVTCTSKHSRNWRAGNMLGQGHSLQEVLSVMGMVVEGVKTTKASYELSFQCGIEMPITQQLYQVLFENKEPRKAVEDLMGRLKTHEMEEVAHN
ncbi:NAD(P)H-dependent glycerol-3-phosphate dehydrogenase [Ammoniphilus resinae]|uniref:Glycerol-3-phosphate dehydrogenase [NAD(P)+] n=1 Tax=Ammoniphilus resinae TaxID=861532 RepID=A0ABS4GT52_9BACL|nr:NAD(P)H-dependent glycerol-3-phosphate dehydrogenase [Ammoniphilus resinae]MBP1933468.1 glycerol-3-phosphate dehydrogenase (NAD(P)+) [Ammoniphilus resinae]